MSSKVEKDGLSEDGLGPEVTRNHPSDDLGLTNDHEEIEIDVDVRKLVRRYEENDARKCADDLEKVSRNDSNIKRDQLVNKHENENLDRAPLEHAEEQYDYVNPTLQQDEDNAEAEYLQPIESGVSEHSSTDINHQKSHKPPDPPTYEFDASAAREASKLRWNTQRATDQSDTLPLVNAKVNAHELTASHRNSDKDYHSKRDSLPPVPDYDDVDNIHVVKKKADPTAVEDGMITTSNEFEKNKQKSKTKWKSNRTVVILVASAVVIIIIAIIFMIIYFTTANKSLSTVTTQPTDVRPTISRGPIVIAGVDLEATVRLSNRAFIPQYNNDLSPQYRSLAQNFTNTMDAVFYGSDLSGIYNGTAVNGFSPGSVIVTFMISLLSFPVITPEDATTPSSGSLEDRLKKIEEDVSATVQDVIEEAADDGILDELGVDSASFVVNDVELDVRFITEAPTMPMMPTTMTTVSRFESTQIPDTIQPTIDCPDDTTVYLETGQFSANVTWPTLNATDDSGQVIITTDMDEGLWDAGMYTVVAMATDPSGNSAQCSFNITVKVRTCPPGWLRRSDSCYRLTSAPPGTYETALNLCTELEAIPVIPNSQVEYDFVNDFLYDLGLQYIWLGCSDVTRERKFDCLDGTRIQSQNSWWGPGQPNAYEVEDCVVLVLAARELQDFYCTFDQPSTLCERVAD